ncbi:ATP-binding cassette sub-family C member Sur-like [Leptidea sinapis]|uniref:ATP-binding cassette sub-family C member Sur-like n=1 Tax=Leptidea sinapis TaxID=189913 RepID=UPI0021C37870|nr:ATP-binding cassette sub-family C member Sur-like [Leptidea sinapis]
MEAICERGNGVCQARALATLLHSLNFYCASISAALVCCHASTRLAWKTSAWRHQDLRGVASIVVGMAWCCGATAAAFLRSADTVYLVMSLMSTLAWVAAAVLHVVLWNRRSASPTLYLAVYWLLTAVSSSAVLFEHVKQGGTFTTIEVYIQSVTVMCAVVVSAVDFLSFYDEVTKRSDDLKSSQTTSNVSYKHYESYFYSRITFFWLNSFFYNIYDNHIEDLSLGTLPEEEKTKISYQRLRNISNYHEVADRKRSLNLWKCYFTFVWPNFYVAGLMKLIGDLCGIIVPLSFAIIIQFIDEPVKYNNNNEEVSLKEFLNNGYTMLVVTVLALIVQALLSQYSTHLVNVEGTRLKTSLQNLLFDKCMRLASWSAAEKAVGERSPLLSAPHREADTQTGMLTNLVTQDTYNIMSCVWICHYTWAIPLKVLVILYVLYTKLGVSAIIGVATSIFIITPLQFFIGKKISDNSKNISKCTDHRASIMSEILNGINVIKLYVWEDLFNEKILQFREVELQHLNKDSIYWSFLTLSAQFSTVLVSVVTFMLHYYLNSPTNLTAVNIFTGLALFNQLSIPLLILPVTVLMVIQAMGVTGKHEEDKRILGPSRIK